MKRLTSFRTTRILNALSRENRKPLQQLMRELLADGAFHYWDDEEILMIKALEFFCLENGYVQDAQDLIRLTGFDMLLDLPESNFEIAVKLVEGDEAFALEAFNGIDGPTVLGRLSEAKSKLLLRAANKALELGRDNIALCIYRVALLSEAYLNPEDDHPLTAAAKDNNHLLGQAYLEAFNEYYHFRFARYKKGYLEDLVLLGKVHFVEIALKCNANIHIPTSTGESLLDIVPNEEVREVLLRYGAQPTTDRRIYLLRQAIISIENGGVNHNVMQEIFSHPTPLLHYSYHDATHPTALPTTWDLMFTVAKFRSPALTYMLPYLQNNCSDKILDNFLSALLGVDTMDRPVRDAESAKQIIEVLELLESHGISYIDPWKMDNEDYRMTAGFNSKVARILDLACYNLENDSKYPDEDFVKIAMLMWRIGKIYGTAEGTRELMRLGIRYQMKFLLEACLTEFEYDFGLLDTDKTSAVWDVVGNELGEEEVTKDLLQYVIDNGGDLNHKNTYGTPLHAAYHYGDTMEFSPVKLLLAAGADRNIEDRFGRKPKEVSKEKFVFLSRGFVWPK